MTKALSALKALAEAANVHPWLVAIDHGEWLSAHDYIEAFDPPTALALITEIETLRAAVDALTVERDATAAVSVKNFKAMCAAEEHAEDAKEALTIARVLANSPAPASDGWKSMESAPRDGTRILCAGGGCEGVQIAEYLTTTGAWGTETATLDDRDDDPEGYSRPTHWRPLPPPLPTKAED